MTSSESPTNPQDETPAQNTPSSEVADFVNEQITAGNPDTLKTLLEIEEHWGDAIREELRKESPWHRYEHEEKAQRQNGNDLVFIAGEGRSRDGAAGAPGEPSYALRIDGIRCLEWNGDVFQIEIRDDTLSEEVIASLPGSPTPPDHLPKSCISHLATTVRFINSTDFADVIKWGDTHDQNIWITQYAELAYTDKHGNIAE